MRDLVSLLYGADWTRLRLAAEVTTRRDFDPGQTSGRGVATTRSASRPPAVTGPLGSRVKPVSSHDGRSMGGSGGSGPAAASTVQPPPSRTANQLRSPSHPLR